MSTLPPPTDEQLRLAFRQVSRPGWPSTLDAALENPLFRTCLYQMARNLNRRGMDRRPAPKPQPGELPLFKGLE